MLTNSKKLDIEKSFLTAEQEFVLLEILEKNNLRLAECLELFQKLFRNPLSATYKVWKILFTKYRNQMEFSNYFLFKEMLHSQGAYATNFQGLILVLEECDFINFEMLNLILSLEHQGPIISQLLIIMLEKIDKKCAQSIDTSCLQIMSHMLNSVVLHNKRSNYDAFNNEVLMKIVTICEKYHGRCSYIESNKNVLSKICSLNDINIDILMKIANILISNFRFDREYKNNMLFSIAAHTKSDGENRQRILEYHKEQYKQLKQDDDLKTADRIAAHIDAINSQVRKNVLDPILLYYNKTHSQSTVPNELIQIIAEYMVGLGNSNSSKEILGKDGRFYPFSNGGSIVYSIQNSSGSTEVSTEGSTDYNKQRCLIS